MASLSSILAECTMRRLVAIAVLLTGAATAEKIAAAELLTLRGHSGWVGGLAFMPDGRRLVSASADHTLRIWDTAGGRLERTLRGHGDYVVAVAVAGDGRIASAGFDGAARLWDADGRPLHTLAGHRGAVVAVAFTADASTLATAGVDRTIRLW